MNEYVCVSSVRKREGQADREEERGTVTGSDTLKILSLQQFSQSVSQSVGEHLFSSDCAAEPLDREMSSVLYVSGAPVLAGAHRKTGRRAV